MTRRTGPVLETGIFCSAMKKNINVLMLAIAAMAAFSCTIEIENPQEIKTFEPKVITVNTDNDVTPITKTSLSGVSVVWTDADAIKGYDGSSVHPSTAVAVSNEGKTAEFTFATVNVEDDLLYLAYPAESVTDIDDDFVYASIPATQDATANSFANGANVAVAEGLVAEPVFSNVGGLLSFIINDDNITSVKLSANESMTGAAKISMGAGTFAQPTITSGNEYVKVTGTIANGTTYYAVVYPGTYTGLKIEVTNSSGQVATFTNSNSMTVERNSIMHIATLSVPGGKWVTPAKGDEYSWTLETGDLGLSATPAASATKGTPSKTWTLAPTWASSGYFGWQADKGVQIGSGGSPCTSYILSTSEYDGFIQTIRVNFSQASSGAASVSVMVGGENLLCDGNAIKNATTSATSYDFTAASLLKGKVKICLTNTAAKAFYLKSIVINPDNRTAQTLSFDQASYSVELTEGTFSDAILTGAQTTVTYSGDADDVATVNSSTGEVTLVSTGTVHITASAVATESYKAGSASYTLTVNPGVSTIAEVLAAAINDPVYTSGIVAQVNAKGFIITDGTNNLAVYQNATPTAVAGQRVKVSGTRGAYNNVAQISSPVITYEETGQEIVRTAMTTITSSNCTGYTSSNYVRLVGALSGSSTTYNVAIAGNDDVSGRLYQISNSTDYSGATIPDMIGSVVSVTGYVSGSSASLLYIAPVDLKYINYDAPSSAGYADNSTITINVHANCSWTAAKGTDENSIIKNVTYNATTVTVTFNANAGDEKTAQVVLTPDAGTGLAAINVTVTQTENGAALVPDDETFQFSTMGYTNGQTVSSVSGTNVNISFTDGSTATAYYSTGSGIRIYGGGSFTVTAKSTHTISSVECTYSGSSYAPASEGYTFSTTGTSADGSLTTGTSSTWTCATDDPATSVTISRNSGSGHWRLQKVKVIFAE